MILLQHTETSSSTVTSGFWYCTSSDWLTRTACQLPPMPANQSATRSLKIFWKLVNSSVQDCEMKMNLGAKCKALWVNRQRIYTVNMPDLIQTGSEADPMAMVLPHWLAYGPDPFGPKPNTVSQNKIRSRLVLQSMIQNSIEPESGKLVEGWPHFTRNWAWWFLHTGLLLDKMCLAKTWPGHSDQIWAGFVQYDLGLLLKNGTELDVGTWTTIYAPVQFWLHTGCTGHNWLQPKRFCIRSGMYWIMRLISINMMNCK